MGKALEFLRTTLLGGVMFLIPIFILVWVFEKLVVVVRKLADPLVERLGLHSTFGELASSLVTLFALAFAAFLIGLFAHTRPGQAVLAWLEGGIIGMLPKFSAMQGMAKSFDSTAADQVEVVFVPTDAGWALGLLMEPGDGEWRSVFLPGSPEWASGSVSYAHISDVHPAGITMAQLALIMRQRGARSKKLYARLAELRTAGEI